MLEQMQDVYNRLNRDTVKDGLLGDLYDRDILFTDPLHRIEGLNNLQRYFEGMYRNVDEISFRYLTQWEQKNEAMLRWEMTFRHPKLNNSAPILVPGVTYLTFDDKITHHQDYFDSNQMIFDHVPVLGSLLGWLKGRLN
ncbi:nuclear transport factor 2 family protein [Saccharospirillum impatiens]|uniref:nuclear transport factor 2 family protein n=1 Tax=Saccharospirillum impatiens TaxID=169438 RepID=UPI00041C7855|nr:nuclear transport factor 2 family protein [Saccharospirillum impatiens]